MDKILQVVKRVSPLAKLVFPLCIFISIITTTTILRQGLLIGDPGVGWHLLTGRVVLEQKLPVYTDPFLTTTLGTPYVATQWLSDLLFWLVYEYLGFQGLHALVLTVGYLLFLVFVPATALVGSSSVLALMVGIALGFASWSVQLFVRPVIFSFLFFGMIVWFLQDPERIRRQSIGSLGLLGFCGFALWANMHPAFPLGWLVIGAALLDSLSRASGLNNSVPKKLISFLCAAVLGTLCNPYGVGLHKNGFLLVQSDFFRSLNVEWLSPDFQSETFLPFLSLLCCILVLALGRWIHVSLGQGVLIVALLFAALESRRFIPFWSIVAAPVFIRAFDFYLRERFGTRVPLGFIPAEWTGIRHLLTFATPFLGYVSVAGFVAVGPVSRDPQAFSEWRPVAAVEAIARHSAERPEPVEAIFHSPSEGGFIAFRFYPARRAWIDDRNELNGELPYREYYELKDFRKGWKEVVEKYQFRYFLLDISAPLATFLASNPRMELLYQDKETVVFWGNPTR